MGPWRLSGGHVGLHAHRSFRRGPRNFSQVGFRPLIYPQQRVSRTTGCPAEQIYIRAIQVTACA